MTVKELAIKILQINHEAKEQARQNHLCDLEEVMSKALDKIEQLCLEQIPPLVDRSINH